MRRKFGPVASTKHWLRHRITAILYTLPVLYLLRITAYGVNATSSAAGFVARAKTFFITSPSPRPFMTLRSTCFHAWHILSKTKSSWQKGEAMCDVELNSCYFPFLANSRSAVTEFDSESGEIEGEGNGKSGIIRFNDRRRSSGDSPMPVLYDNAMCISLLVIFL
ncbi:hypothetical protein MRB53_041800 [Persea americana]|nr:hypothetical protein MRB53_041800 [Persea americana]